MRPENRLPASKFIQAVLAAVVVEKEKEERLLSWFPPAVPRGRMRKSPCTVARSPTTIQATKNRGVLFIARLELEVLGKQHFNPRHTVTKMQCTRESPACLKELSAVPCCVIFITPSSTSTDRLFRRCSSCWAKMRQQVVVF